MSNTLYCLLLWMRGGALENRTLKFGHVRTCEFQFVCSGSTSIKLITTSKSKQKWRGQKMFYDYRNHKDPTASQTFADRRARAAG